MDKTAKNSIKQIKSVTGQPVSSFLYFVVSRFLERHLKMCMYFINTHTYLYKMNVQMKLNKSKDKEGMGAEKHGRLCSTYILV